MVTGSRYQIDMCHGPLLGKIVRFAIPLMVANTVQCLFNAVDLVVIGRYASCNAMAAVGSCGSLISMSLSVFFGLSVGANVLVARYIGAKDDIHLFRAVHTAVALALYGGILLAAVCWTVARPALVLMRPPPEVLPQAVLYVRLYCAGIPFLLLYNFGSSILRATGDTRRPMLYMLTGGAIKTILNLFLVRVFHWDVAGVAVASMIANAVSAGLVLTTLSGLRDGCRLHWKRIRIYGTELLDNIRIGLPAGIQGALFGVSNLIIQSTVNTFGAEAMAGNAAAASLEGLIYVAFISYYFAEISFVSQNHGAKKYKRIVKSFWYCMALSVISTAIMGLSFRGFDTTLLSLYNSDPAVVKWGLVRVKYLISVYFLYATMEMLNGALRGLGYSLIPMVVSAFGVCAFRVFWVMWIFPLCPTMDNLLVSYPVSWTLVSAVNGVIFYYICRRLLRSAAATPKHRPAPVAGGDGD